MDPRKDLHRLLRIEFILHFFSNFWTLLIWWPVVREVSKEVTEKHFVSRGPVLHSGSQNMQAVQIIYIKKNLEQMLQNKVDGKVRKAFLWNAFLKMCTHFIASFFKFSHANILLLQWSFVKLFNLNCCAGMWLGEQTFNEATYSLFLSHTAKTAFICNFLIQEQGCKCRILLVYQFLPPC